MKIKLCKKQYNQTRKGRYIDREIAKKLIERGREKRNLKDEKDFKFIIQKYKDTPKDRRPVVYNNAVRKYAKIQLENGLTEFAIYLLEDINNEIELANAYCIYAQSLREKGKTKEATETEKKLEEICIKNKDNCNIRKLLTILYIRQGKVEDYENLQDKSFVDILKDVYFNEVVKKSERIQECNSRQHYFENLDSVVKTSNGLDIFTGYKMYEYPNKGICVIDKVFNENGITYIFPQNIIFDLQKISRSEMIKKLDTDKSVQKQEYKEDYYNVIQEKMKRAELEGLVIEEKKLKELFSEEGE